MTWLSLVGCAVGTPSSTTTTTTPPSTGDTGPGATNPWTSVCDDPATVTAAPECSLTPDPGGGVALCAWQLSGSPASTHGTFTKWLDGRVEFTADDGSDPGVWGRFDPANSEIPDLGAAGPVTVTITGMCDVEAGLFGTVTVADDAGALRLVLGTVSDLPAGGFTMTAPPVSSCPAFPAGGCIACGANVPLQIVGPGFDVTLWQGQTADPTGWHVEATSALYDSGGDLCEGASHLLWWAAPR